jgi:prepilin peptidase CpaA
MDDWGSLPASWSGQAVLAAFVFALVLAAISDFVSLRIPNWLTGTLAAAFPAAALVFGHGVDWLSHIEAGVAVFAAGAMLFACRVLGGGDVKLLAATAFWTGLQLVPTLIMTVAFAGGIFAALILGLRHPVVHASLLQTLRRLPAFAQKKMPIPYGFRSRLPGFCWRPVCPSWAERRFDSGEFKLSRPSMD